MTSLTERKVQAVITEASEVQTSGTSGGEIFFTKPPKRLPNEIAISLRSDAVRAISPP
jgi:hypothetical protein